jgi:pimeloyl-ACP methyl ester carboxylesterase
MVTSNDGTAIAFERFGDGPPLILAVGAFNDRSTGTPLATFLASRFSVMTYDRRGRGESGDTAPYAIEREVEDLAALIAEVGGSASVFGYSSGACLALQAAARGLSISKLALYEAPYLADGDQARAQAQRDHAARLAELIADGRRGDAVEYFQMNVVGIPENVVAQLRHAPFRLALEAMAHTLVYEVRLLGDFSIPSDLAARVTVPTFVISGDAVPFMSMTAHALAGALPNGQARVLQGQTHDIDPSILGPVLQSFFSN